MPVDARIALGTQAPNIVQGFQTGFEGGQAMRQAPLKQQQLQTETEDGQIKLAKNKIGMLGSLLGRVKDQNTYTQARNIAINNGLASANQIPEMYDPAQVEMWNGVIAQSAEALRARELAFQERGGIMAAVADRAGADPKFRQNLMDTKLMTQGFGGAQGGGVAPIPGYKEGKAAIEGAKEATKLDAAYKTKAEQGLPKILDQATNLQKYVDELAVHPGLSSAVGAKGLTGGLLGGWIPGGTDAASFTTRLKQIQGSNFLQAFEALKGGGAITEVEGQKGTDAIARLDTASTEEEFKAALQDLKDVIDQGVARAKGAAGKDKAAIVTEDASPGTDNAKLILQDAGNLNLKRSARKDAKALEHYTKKEIDEFWRSRK